MLILAVGGVIATAVFAGLETPKALTLLELEREEKGEELSKVETMIIAFPVYVPAIAMGTATIVCILGANALSRRQQASLISAYGMIESSYKEYRKKVTELYGENADREVAKEIAKDRIVDAPKSAENTNLFYLPFYDGYFESTLEDVILAEYHFNRNFTLRGYASFNELLAFLDLEPIGGGDDIGWSLDAGFAFYGYQWVDFEHHDIVTEDGRTVYEIFLPFIPTCDYLS